ncbi:hypothetical protein C2G38_2240328 [Gigaspora rosea]|uniref:Uncharacterized protein n=1 Tax=Gigaspora rosea TaxID=44941 RepID=A0A397W0H1_9GLOM|nr:hypothetical protein C2G38_2240328 [Gigaspora rosea]
MKEQIWRLLPKHCKTNYMNWSMPMLKTLFYRNKMLYRKLSRILPPNFNLYLNLYLNFRLQHHVYRSLGIQFFEDKETRKLKARVGNVNLNI